ncbi:Tetratricopeptide repeat-containing protein [Nitrosomonas aestuarii]|uniref:Tetratricopeptide repeat-containing protein n=1 Tax=Nitrosomonas aestuarii TaxID=52441 RepID=A0A1I4EFC1_9PROT|nr:tetratricopeptide repeat protein [Nitrosomonas aestuarii]SFL03297.1 Tetratricopeptide repeat-containing protein [Nitrosomonas aestuarii]
MNIWNLKNKSVLIVDDFDKMRLLIREILSPLMPQKITMAKNGEEAIELLEKQCFDIVLCDYKLGDGKDGQQILEEARHRDLLKYNAIFIMITAENTSAMVMGAIDFLPDDYISKPFTPSQLQKRLEKASRKKAQLDNIATAINDKNYSKAITLCEQRLQENPTGQTEVLRTKGELLKKLGRLNEAENFYTSLLEERNITWVRQSLGQVYFQKGNYSEAETEFKLLLKENPANVNALDWLASTLEKQGELEDSQNILQQAIQRSPKSPVRQRKLGAIALINGAYDVAEKAYEYAINECKHSCFSSMADCSGLIKSMIKQGKTEEASKSIENIQKKFKNNPEARFHTALASSVLYRETNELEKCRENLETVLKLINSQSEEISTEAALDITKNCLALDNPELAINVIKQLVNNHSENEQLMNQVRDIYEKAGRSEAGNAIIQNTKKEIIIINNEGVKLAQDGKLEQSIEFFIQAAKGLPNNATINFNAAYSMIQQMKKTGDTGKYFSLSKTLLEQGHKIDPQNQKYFQLIKLVEDLSSQAA